MDSQKPKTIDSKYIQQHLANERTYLAWIRTALAFIGIGFLVSNYHFTTPSLTREISVVFAKGIGFASVCLGIATIIFSTSIYFAKGTAINNGTYKQSKLFVLLLSILLTLLVIFFGVYFLFLLN
ncbi:YidH family protein [Bacillus solitudinis]|uniref:YidH family protein n=1 Tax=Bacillus solitudinis TaxID=2014074 RepID=UPI000C24809F|nr:DUF202 domain-containing protein [Bacillus solitudinis]